MNFSDREHLWFDPNWSGNNNRNNSGSHKSANSSSGSNNNNNNNGSGTCSGETAVAAATLDSGKDDPMAEMLEKNAKNSSSNKHLFINDLHQKLTSSASTAAGSGGEYAEVEGFSTKKPQESQHHHHQGPYATTTLVSNSVRVFIH